MSPSLRVAGRATAWVVVASAMSAWLYFATFMDVVRCAGGCDRDQPDLDPWWRGQFDLTLLGVGLGFAALTVLFTRRVLPFRFLAGLSGACLGVWLVWVLCTS